MHIPTTTHRLRPSLRWPRRQDRPLGGTQVTINGSYFTGAYEVDFGSFPTSFIVNSDSSITAVSPSYPAATIDVVVRTYSGSSSTGSADHFTYVSAGAPTITS